MMKKGFTLIELLIVIAILGVLAAGVVTAINPVQRINQGSDSRVKTDVGSMALAALSYYTLRQYYPSALADLVTAGDIKSLPTPPSGYSAYAISVTPAGCTTALKTCTDITISGQIKVPATAGNTLWCWHSSDRSVGEGTTCTAP